LLTAVSYVYIVEIVKRELDTFRN